MLDINILVKRLKNRLPAPVYMAVDSEFWIDILMSETLPTMSTYYPKVIRGITVDGKMSIETLDSYGRKNRSCKYVIPLVDEMYPYIGISSFNYPRNYTGGGTYANSGFVDAFAAKVMSSANMPDVRFTASLESPNIVVINPPPKVHMDFSISLYQMKKLEEIRTGYHEMFKDLYEADCKIALFYKFFNVSDGGAFGGIELKDYIADFKEYESKRVEILSSMDADYFMDPDRFEEVANIQAGFGFL